MTACWPKQQTSTVSGPSKLPLWEMRLNIFRLIVSMLAKTSLFVFMGFGVWGGKKRMGSL